MSDDLSIPNPGYRGSRAGRYGTGPVRVRQGMDPDTRRLTMFAGGLGAVLALLIGASALMGHRSGEVPVISPDPRPIREKPVNPGGMKIDGAENDVFSGGSDTSNARLAPAPESPNTKALRAEAAPPAPPVSTDGIQGAAVEAPARAAPAAAAPAAAARTAPVASAPVPAARPTVVASAAPKPAPTPAKPAVVEEAHPQSGGHTPMVQLAALGSEEAARTEWALLVKKMPELLSGKQPSYSRTERDGHTFWRVRTSGFADVGQARGFCERVRTKGAGCSVADF